MEIEKAVSIQKAGEGAAEEWLELPNGCLCCTIKTTALQAIESLLQRKSGLIDYILLETTGLADPYPIINSFWADEALECRAYLDGVVCLVDAKNIAGLLKEWQVLMQQIVLADIILISKTDLVEKEEDLQGLKERLRELNPLAKVRECKYGQVGGDISMLLDLKAYGAVDCSFAHQKHREEAYLDLMSMLNFQESKRDHREVSSLRLSTSKPIDRAEFEKWLFQVLWSDDSRFKIFRAKGLMQTERAKRDFVVQAVQELYEITELEGAKKEVESVLVLLGTFHDGQIIDSIKESFYSLLLPKQL